MLVSSPDFTEIGVILHGYASDITRTFFPGQKQEMDCPSNGNGNKPSLREMWEIVHSAQTAGIDTITLNTTAAEVDLAAREVIEKAKLGKYFGHRLGHGLGDLTLYKTDDRRRSS
jgi:Xaa-Pro aminopeptidase